MEKRDTPESIADHINKSHKAIEGLVRKHCVGSAVLTIFSVGVFFAAYASLVFLFPSPSHEELVKSMDRSNTELARLATELSRAIPQSQVPGIVDIRNAVSRQANLHKEAVEDVRAAQRDIPPQGVSLLQLLGGSAILALLAYLGLQRLQTIDTASEGRDVSDKLTYLISLDGKDECQVNHE